MSETEQNSPDFLDLVVVGSSEGNFTYTVVPSHDGSVRVNGVIIYATDETNNPKHL